MTLLPRIRLFGFAKRLATVSVIALLGAACASNPQTVDANSEVPLKAGQSLMGNYLAGLHAQSEGDMAAAGLFLGAAMEHDLTNEFLLRRTFLVHLSAGNLIEATRLAQTVIDDTPDDLFANLTLAADDLANGRYPEARAHMEATEPGGLNIYFKPLFIAWSYVGDGVDNQVDGEAALAALAVLKENPATTLLHNAHAALINAAVGNNEEAETLFVSMIETQGGMSLHKTRMFGAFYEGVGSFDKAGAVYNGYIDEHGSSQYFETPLARVAAETPSSGPYLSAAQGAAEALFDLTGSLRQQNAVETALLISQLGLHMHPDYPALQLVTGGTLESIEQYKAAKKIYENVNPSSDFSWDAQLRVATILDDLDQSEQALEVLSQIAAAKPEMASPLIDMGDIYRRLERYEESISAYDQAVARIGTPSENQWSLYYTLGISLERHKDWPRAEASFKKALELNPDQPYVLNYLAYSWIEQGINLDEATAMLKSARDQRPNDAYIIDSVGWAKYQMGEYQGAVDELEEAVELMPQDPIVNDHLGDAYWQVGRHREARFQWKRALNLEPEEDTIPILKDKIKFGLEVPQLETDNQDDNG